MDPTPEMLYAEIDAAIAVRERYLRPIADRVAELTGGPGYRGGASDNPQSPSSLVYENVAYEFISNDIAVKAFGCPRVSIAGEHAPEHDEQIAAETSALNQFAIDSRMEVLLRRLAVDCAMGFGIAMVSAGESPRPRGYWWPKAARLSPGMFLWDPEATHEDEFEWVGHAWPSTKEKLLARTDAAGRALYDPVAVDQLVVDAGPDDDRRRRLGTPPRGRVWCYDIYVRETRMIYTMGYGGTNASGDGSRMWLRAPREAVCHPRGPYVIFGHGIVPEDPVPLSQLAAAQGQTNELNIHAKQIAEDAGTAKRIVAYDKSDPELAKNITVSANGTTMGVNGDPRAALFPFEYGGPQAANLTYSEILKQRVNRLLGLTDTRRGEVDPDSTATAEQIAEEGTSRREQFGKKVFQEQVGQIFSRALWLMRYKDPETGYRPVRRDVVISDPISGERSSALYVGGGRPGGLDQSDEPDVQIEPYSMEYTSEGLIQRRAIQNLEMVLKVAPVARQFPEYDWERMLDDHFNAMNQVGGGSRYINAKLLAVFQGMTTGVPPQLLEQANAAEGVPGAGQVAPESEEGGLPQEFGGLLAAAAGV